MTIRDINEALSGTPAREESGEKASGGAHASEGPPKLVCHQLKGPLGRSVAPAAANSYCGWDCAGYTQEPRPSELWPGERYGDSLGHMKWHEEVPG